MKLLKHGSKTSRILAHLAAGKSITPVQALSRYGCFSLSQRIGELKRRGHRIDTQMVATRGGSRVASYRLHGVRG